MRPEIFQSTKAAGIAGGTGAALILFGAGFENDVVAFGIAAITVPLLGWGLHGLYLIHSGTPPRLMTIGFWVAEAGVILLAGGYLLAGVAAAADNTSLMDLASLYAIIPAFLALLPLGLAAFGMAAINLRTLGPVKRFVPLVAALGGIVGPQFMLLGFTVLGWVIWSHDRQAEATGS
jgi:hypothetical protein